MSTSLNKLPVVAPANHIPGPGQGRWSYKEYAALPNDGNQYEVINGVLFMTPSPSGAHQDAVGEIFAYLREHIKQNNLGLVRMAPFDVELSPGTVVQPDVFVILNEHFDRITDNRILGAPDLVVEVASPSTAIYDRHNKLDAYAHAGVAEYWIVDTDARAVEVLVLAEAGIYRSLGIFRAKAILPSMIMPGLSVAVEKFFM
jgi:Uma2 family endonuclease